MEMEDNKPKRRSRRRRGSNKTTWIVGAAVLLLLVFLLWGPGSSGRTQEDTPTGAASSEPATEPVPPQKAEASFPMEVEDGKLKITSLFQFTGVNPDCGDAMGEDIASLAVENCSGSYLERAEITVSLADGTSYQFAMEDVPAGKTVWAFALDNGSYDTAAALADVECRAAFTDRAPLMEDAVSVSVEETAVTLSNSTGAALENLVVTCHCLFDEAYFGGRTYSYPVDSIPAGGSVEIQAEECYLGQAEVVRVQQAG